MPMTEQALERRWKDAKEPAPEVRVDVLSARKRSSTVRGARVYFYAIELRLREGRRERFLSLEADAYGNVDLPASETSGEVRSAILDAVRAKLRR